MELTLFIHLDSTLPKEASFKGLTSATAWHFLSDSLIKVGKDDLIVHLH